MMADLFVGGSETTTNALAAGVMLLIQHPEVWEQLKSDPEQVPRQLRRGGPAARGPVQGLLREAAEDVELHGVTIPAGSIVNAPLRGRQPRRAAASSAPPSIDLDRKHPRTHLAFGVGTHHCLGAPLARRELVLRLQGARRPHRRDVVHRGRERLQLPPELLPAGVKELHIGFRPAGR